MTEQPEGPQLRLRPFDHPAPIFMVGSVQAEEPLILACGHDHIMRATRPLTGEIVWEVEVGGLVFAIRCEDINGDGRDEIIVAAGEPSIRVFSADGQLLWNYSNQRTVFLDVSTADIDSDGEIEVLAAGHDRSVTILSNTGRMKSRRMLSRQATRRVEGLPVRHGSPSIFFLPLRGPMGELDFRTEEMLWTASTAQDEDEEGRLINGSMARRVLAREGVDLIVVGSQPDRVTALTVGGRRLWQTDLRPRDGGGLATRAWPQVAFADLMGTGNPLVAAYSVSGQFAALSTIEGSPVLRHRFDFRPYGMAAMRLGNGEADHLIFGSAFGGDRRYYLAQVDGDGLPPEELTAEGGQDFGHAELVATSLAASSSPDILPPPESPPYQLGVNLNFLPGKISDFTISTLAHLTSILREAWASPSLEVVFNLVLFERGLGQSGPLTFQGPEMDAEDILRLAAGLENEKTAFSIRLAQHARPTLSLKTLEEIIEECPLYFRGVECCESNVDAGLLDMHIEDNVGPALELFLLRRNLRFYMRENRRWWLAISQTGKYHRILFAHRNIGYVCPLLDSGDPNNPEITLGTMAGLWQMGVIRDWGLSTGEAPLCFNHVFDFGDSTRDNALFRQMIAASALGANLFWIDQLESMLDPPDGCRDLLDYVRNPHKAEGDSQPRLNSRGQRIKTIANLCRSGSLKRPEPGAVCMNRMAIHLRMQDHLPETLLPSAFETQPNLGRGVFTNSQYALMTTSENYFGRVLYGLRNGCDGFFPPTPNGFVMLVPVSPAGGDERPFDNYLPSDGITIIAKEKPMNASLAGKKLRDAASEFREKLPFHADGAFIIAHRLSEWAYRLHIVSPGLLAPQSATVVVQSNTGPALVVRDVVSNSEIHPKHVRFKVEIKAGGFRILDITIDDSEQTI